MTARLCSLLVFIALLITPAFAKNKKIVLPEYVLRARTVLVVIDPDAGEPLTEPGANATARDAVERALMEWGRFQLVMDGQESDLIITVRTGDDRAVRPTIKGGPLDQRPGVGQTTDSSVRIGGQRGQPPPLNDPSMDPQRRGPRVTNEVGQAEDAFAVYHGALSGGHSNPLDAPPVWRYAAKDCLRAPQVSAVENFRKTIAEAEKPQPPKKP